MAYHHETAISDSQRLILHHVTSAPGPPPAATPIDSYARFSEGDYTPWIQLEEALEATAPPASSSAQFDVFEDEDEEVDEEIPGAEGESETSAGESSEEADK